MCQTLMAHYSQIQPTDCLGKYDFIGTATPIADLLSIAAFRPQWHSLVETETVQPTKPDIVIIWPFTEKDS